MVELNIVGTFNLSRLYAWHMSKNESDTNERGVIINTASIAAFEGQIGQVAYTAATAGIAAMCPTMARDLGSVDIRVVAIAPSLFATGVTSAIPDEMATNLVKDAAFPRRMGRPDEYAKASPADHRQPDAQLAVPAPGRRPEPRPQVGPAVSDEAQVVGTGGPGDHDQPAARQERAGPVTRLEGTLDRTSFGRRRSSSGRVSRGAARRVGP